MSRVRMLPSALLLVAAMIAGGWLVQRAVRGEDRSARDSAQLLESVMERVRESYVEPVDDEKLWELAAVGLVGELGDPNTAYLSPDRLEKLNESSANTYHGVGMTLDVRDGVVIVMQTRSGSPAERAGILAGDRIVEVDGESLQGATMEEARGALLGPAGTQVAVTIERGQGARLPKVLERADIRVSAVARAVVLDGGVGYLAVNTFSDSSEAEVAATVDSLQRAGATSMIIDLRGNPGGLLSQGVAVADLFLKPGQRIVSIKGRIPATNAVYVDESDERWGALPLVVLVNGGTASAAEIVAGALQDHDRALVMGRVTYGKGSAQAVYPLTNGAGLKLTNARWYTPLGRSIEVAPPGEERLADADTARPVFRSATGRAIYGGGGIVPDVIAGDSITDPAERRFYAELTGEFSDWRQVLSSQAAALIRSGRIRDSLFAVDTAWRELVRNEMDRRRIIVSRTTFNAAGAMIDRVLGNEIARQAFGVPYAARRRVRTDSVVQRAAAVLMKAKTPGQVFGE